MPVSEERLLTHRELVRIAKARLRAYHFQSEHARKMIDRLSPDRPALLPISSTIKLKRQHGRYGFDCDTKDLLRRVNRYRWIKMAISLAEQIKADVYSHPRPNIERVEACRALMSLSRQCMTFHVWMQDYYASIYGVMLSRLRATQQELNN